MKKTIITLAISCFFLSCKTVIPVSCPNGMTEYIQKNPYKAYEAYVKTTEVNVDAAVSGLKLIDTAKVSLDVKRKVTKLRADLDTYSAVNQDVLKGAYIAYAQSPCDPEVKSKYFKILEGVRSSNEAIATLAQKVKDIVTVGNVGGIDQEKLTTTINAFEAVPKPQEIR